MPVAKKMEELLVTWLSNDATYESIMDLVETHKASAFAREQSSSSPAESSLPSTDPHGDNHGSSAHTDRAQDSDLDSPASPRGVIPPFYPNTQGGIRRPRRAMHPPTEVWDAPLDTLTPGEPKSRSTGDHVTLEPARSLEDAVSAGSSATLCVRDVARAVFLELGIDPPLTSPASADHEEDDIDGPLREKGGLRRKYLLPEQFTRVTKEVCRFPSFFSGPLYQRILLLWNEQNTNQAPMEVVTYEMLEWFWRTEMEPYDAVDRFFRLVKQPHRNHIDRDDFLPFIKALLNDHPGLEFLSSHTEFQEKYAITVITRIFYCVDTCHSGRITSRQLRRSDLLEAFQQVDEEEDINKVTRYLSYEHFYVLYCRFWELDHDRDYRITREDLLKYGEHSLSHMIVDRIFDAAPRPFETDRESRDKMSYESFIYFMLSEEDKSNEVSVRYWFNCVDVDGDGKLNNMEMRSFYAVQHHRMQCTGHEVVPFEDMLCQMMDMIKPANQEYFVVEDFLQPECRHVSGALFDALFNLNKYVLFEQRDPFLERQKREDEFDCDWDRFACIDYNRLAMEEEAREEEAMEIDWVNVDEEDDPGAAAANQNISGTGFASG